MSLHKEINFETEICQHLAAHGWLYAEGDAASYARARALFPADVLAWVQATQPQAWEVLTKNHGAQAEETLLARLRDQLDQRGTLDVLRHGIELLGLNKPLLMAQFKPALAINPDILARYAANRLRVVRIRVANTGWRRDGQRWQTGRHDNFLEAPPTPQPGAAHPDPPRFPSQRSLPRSLCHPSWHRPLDATALAALRTPGTD